MMLVLIAFATVFSVLALMLTMRHSYKRALLEARLERARTNFPKGKVLWYNSAKGSLNDTYHSCWAKVTGEPFYKNKVLLFVPVELSIAGSEPVIHVVPAESLVELAQINS